MVNDLSAKLAAQPLKDEDDQKAGRRVHQRLHRPAGPAGQAGHPAGARGAAEGQGTSIGNLLGFMHAYNLRFGPATTHQGEERLSPALRGIGPDPRPDPERGQDRSEAAEVGTSPGRDRLLRSRSERPRTNRRNPPAVTAISQRPSRDHRGQRGDTDAPHDRGPAPIMRDGIIGLSMHPRMSGSSTDVLDQMGVRPVLQFLAAYASRRSPRRPGRSPRSAPPPDPPAYLPPWRPATDLATPNRLISSRIISGWGRPRATSSLAMLASIRLAQPSRSRITSVIARLNPVLSATRIPAARERSKTSRCAGDLAHGGIRRIEGDRAADEIAMDRLEPRSEVGESGRIFSIRSAIACGLGRPITRLTSAGRHREADGLERLAEAAIDRILVVDRRPGHVEDHQFDRVHRACSSS